MPMIDGRYLSIETLKDLRKMTDVELLRFRDAHVGFHKAIVKAAEAEMKRREESHDGTD